jgi:hypothetical protein
MKMSCRWDILFFLILLKHIINKTKSGLIISGVDPRVLKFAIQENSNNIYKKLKN